MKISCRIILDGSLYLQYKGKYVGKAISLDLQAGSYPDTLFVIFTLSVTRLKQKRRFFNSFQSCGRGVISMGAKGANKPVDLNICLFAPVDVRKMLENIPKMQLLVYFWV